MSIRSSSLHIKIALFFGAFVLLSTTAESTTSHKNDNSQKTSTLRKPSPSYTGPKFFNTQTFTLKNGLTVYLIESHRTPVVGISVVYRVGSADDPRGKAGLAHFLEHIMFKGQKGSSSERLMREAEALGGQVNAYTSFDQTVYYEIVPKEHSEKFLRYEADRMKSIEARLEDVTPEINVVLEEENMRMGNNPFAQFMAALRSTFFTHHPYGTMPIGYRHEIKSYTPEDVKSFHTKHYGPNNAFVILSGSLTLAEAKAMMTKYFSSIPRRGGWTDPNRNRVVEPPLTYKAIIEKTSDRISQPYIYKYLPAPQPIRENDDVFEALHLGFYALANATTGLLHRILVEQKKVAQNFSLGVDSHAISQNAITMVTQTAPTTTIAELEQIIQTELKRLLDKGLTEEQLTTYKQELLVQGDYIKDTLQGGADSLINPLIANIPLDRIEHWQDVLSALTVDDVNEALRRYLQSDVYVTGYLKPVPAEPQTTTQSIVPNSVPHEAIHAQ